MPHPSSLLPTVLLALAAAMPAGESLVRIVGADEVQRSPRRGVCANHLSEADFRALAPGVSWFYTWYHQTADVAPAELGFEFLPMMWGDQPERLAGLEAWLAAGNHPRAVLAINEPNLKGQAFISPEACADLFRRTVAIADRYKIPVVGPHMAIGSSAADSITATDPLERKPVTYTFMVPYLKAFMHYAGTTPVPALGIHAYGDINELRWAVEATWKEFQRPVWVTEFAQWGAKDEAAELDYLIQAVDFLERSPHVAGYAWFKERADHKRISLLEPKAGELTARGKAYVDMPVIDPALAYRLPGRIQAEAARELSEFSVRSTGDGDGLAELRAGKSGATATVRLASERAGRYRLSLRAWNGGKGSVSVGLGKRRLGEIKLAGGAWETAVLDLDLPKGVFDVVLTCGQSGTAINWLELQAVP